MSEKVPARRELKRFFICLALGSFVLNWIWEMLQMPSYKEMAGRPFETTAARCSRATVGDVAITFWIYVLGALAAHNLRWPLRARWNVYYAVALLGPLHAF